MLRVSNVTVNYGSSRGIADVSLEASPGAVLGLLGPNGAGKTTLIRAILDFLHPASGSIEVNGVDSRNPAARASVSYLPGDLVLPPRLSGQQCIDRYLGKKAPSLGTSISTLAQRLELDLTRPAGALSKGNRQKIGLILAFAPNASLVILDEPTSGLDPVLQGVFSELVEEAKDRHAAVILSSHVLSELEELAQSVAVLRQGELVAHESIDELRERAHQGLRVQVLRETERLECAEALRMAGIDVTMQGAWLAIRVRGSIDPLIKILARFSVTAIESLGSDLREVFLDFYSDHEEGV